MPPAGDELGLHLTTTVPVPDAVGRASWGVVRHAHPRVVARMLRRAALPG